MTEKAENMELIDYLKLMVTHEASDLYLTTGAVPSVKIQGTLKPLSTKPFAPDQVKRLAYQVMDPEQINEFESLPEMNLALPVSGLGRFRVSLFRQRNQVAMVVRHIKTEIPDPESLSLPAVLKELIMERRGLILFVGATGSGKSTSTASLLDHRNSHSSGYILTIEDPIEFVHQHKKSIINQRELGIDTFTYEDALKNALRQAPDVLLIGEIRDRETMEHALNFAETGHLVVSTMHASNANQTFDRILNFFPEDRRNQLLHDMSLNIRAIVSQRLVPSVDGKRVLAVEILVNTPRVSDLILKGEFTKLKEPMEKSANSGMQSFDLALFDLFKQGRITLDDALKNADSPNNLRLKIQLEESGHSDGGGLSLAEDQGGPFKLR